MPTSSDQYLDRPRASPTVLVIGDGSVEPIAALAGSLGFQVVQAMGPRSVQAMDRARLAAVIVTDGQYVQNIAESLLERSRVPLVVVVTAAADALTLYQLGATDVLPSLDPRCLAPKLAVYLDLFRRAQGSRWEAEADSQFRDQRRAEADAGNLLAAEQYVRPQLGAPLGTSPEGAKPVML